MSQSILSAPHFHNEEAAFAFVEAHRGRTARSAHIAATRTRQDRTP